MSSVESVRLFIPLHPSVFTSSVSLRSDIHKLFWVFPNSRKDGSFYENLCGRFE
jgi:hypothetical protein